MHKNLYASIVLSSHLTFFGFVSLPGVLTVSHLYFMFVSLLYRSSVLVLLDDLQQGSSTLFWCHPILASLSASTKTLTTFQGNILNIRYYWYINQKNSIPNIIYQVIYRNIYYILNIVSDMFSIIISVPPPYPDILYSEFYYHHFLMFCVNKSSNRLRSKHSIYAKFSIIYKNKHEWVQTMQTLPKQSWYPWTYPSICHGEQPPPVKKKNI